MQFELYNRELLCRKYDIEGQSAHVYKTFPGMRIRGMGEQKRFGNKSILVNQLQETKK